MSHTNHKNRLQEYCQQHKIDLPSYNSFQTNNGFRCIITLHSDKIKKQSTGTGTKKKEAEKHAAQNMLKIITEEQTSKMIYISHEQLANTHQYITIYIDLENLNVKQLQNLFNNYKFNPTQFLFIGFLSTGHHFAETLFEFKDIAFEKILVPSTRSDAADIGMIMHALTTHNGKAHTIVFVSRDRFSCVFSELADKGFCTSTKTKFKHCSNFKEMVDLTTTTLCLQ